MVKRSKKYEKEIKNLGFEISELDYNFGSITNDANIDLSFLMDCSNLSTCCGVEELGEFIISWKQSRDILELFKKERQHELKAFLCLLKIMFLEHISDYTTNIKRKVIVAKPILFTTNGEKHSLFVEKALEDLEEFQKVSVTVNPETGNVITVWIGLAKR